VNQKEKTAFSYVAGFLGEVTKITFTAGLLMVVSISVWFFTQYYGLILIPVPVTGASMLPTLPEKGNIEFYKMFNFKQLPDFLTPKISRGDIVVFHNEKTSQELKRQSKTASGFVKRVIGVPGDRVEIQDGFVKLNGTLLSEPYTLKPRSTFGGREIGDCEGLIVPKDKFFVLGDNRKISTDSRHIGLISFSDIDFFIPFKTQKEEFGSSWRDASRDLSTKNESLFNTTKYLKLLNEERSKNKLPPLKYEAKLETSARRRASEILANKELERGRLNNDSDIERAMSEAGYSNRVFGEFPILGYYDEQELYEVFMEKAEAKRFLLNKDYDDIGVSTFIGETKGCPVQVVVQHLGGYIPPSYTLAEKQGWEKAVSDLNRIQSGWLELKNYDGFYENNKREIDRINEIIAIRLSRAKQILNKIESLQWLSEAEKNFIKEDVILGEEQSELANLLNSKQ
jgi:signal peptidase I